VNIEDIFDREIKKCNIIKDKDARIQCKINLLRDITRIQDYVNLNTIRDLDNSDDDRWIPLHMIDDLNAMILGILEHNARSKPISRDRYIKSKMSAFEDKYIMLTGDYS